MTNWMAQAMAGEVGRTRRNTSINDAITNSPARQRINEIRVAFRTACDDVRGDPSLSNLGKQQMIARAWLNTRTEIARLAKADFDTQVARYNAVEKQVFGVDTSNGADAVSFRDATDRAAALKDSDAAVLALGTAELSGDSVLAKAIVLQAWQRDWTAVLDEYALTHGTLAEKLDELATLRHNLDSTVSRMGGGMAANVPKPSELQNLSLKDIEAYAAADPSQSLEAVQRARIAGTATPQQEAAARAQAAAELQGQ